MFVLYRVIVCSYLVLISLAVHTRADACVSSMECVGIDHSTDINLDQTEDWVWNVDELSRLILSYHLLPDGFIVKVVINEDGETRNEYIDTGRETAGVLDIVRKGNTTLEDLTPIFDAKVQKLLELKAACIVVLNKAKTQLKDRFCSE